MEAMAAMTFYLDARSAEWRSICAAILEFRGWRDDHSGYAYIRSNAALRPEIAGLCSHLDLDDAYSFADDDGVADPAQGWIDLAAGWQPH